MNYHLTFHIMQAQKLTTFGESHGEATCSLELSLGQARLPLGNEVRYSLSIFHNSILMVYHRDIDEHDRKAALANKVD
jgi:hypothetical protein